MNKIYPEKVGHWVRRQECPPPKFPDECPACGSKALPDERPGWRRDYECGGAYKCKPQIQNHTEVFWGKCGRE